MIGLISHGLDCQRGKDGEGAVKALGELSFPKKVMKLLFGSGRGEKV